MIWILVIVIVGYFLIRFFIDLNKDNYDLQSQTLSEKFKFLVDALNEAAFNGLGSVTVLDKRSFNLYQTGQNQIINFII